MPPWGTLKILVEDQVLQRTLTAPRYRLGREHGSEIYLEPGWVSRRQASIARHPSGAILTNLARYKMRVTSDALDSTVYRGGAVLISRGDTAEAAWPGMPDRLTALLAVSLPEGVKRLLPRGKGAGTLRPSPSWIEDASPVVRYRMAVLFRHLLCGGERPSALYEAAAAELGVSVGVLKQTVHRLRVQAARSDHALVDVDALGRYLVDSRSLTKNDLDLPGRM
ncbi:hypothetical protein LKO27_10250 [Tessaracoccus sp. OS52]|uniref:FHA domain-containing protein n=1 Tax=Tessaracoccus sp. OS52 TaxID=2886691 RepID=UPI001D11739D|nr:FHA domain-containing protein [Tessaracoccus sp. OS52]MCC2593786.1 hypothetical protein [Tessaracoccus sp. OS52]